MDTELECILKNCTEICHKMLQKHKKKATPDYLNFLDQIIKTQLEMMCYDLKAFSGHAKRSTIGIEDIKLLLRRNDDICKLVMANCNICERKKKN
ncbi:hypothetical protein A3Q56_05957 [Intoshia linei]|uniref:Centromere protein S n=1 Tax=Intoshia linei TaxID=1819745 RepID=A0A177AWC3_9BILA|nr:hypothetical protein A3Q56_05957 [Intoshia linei]